MTERSGFRGKGLSVPSTLPALCGISGQGQALRRGTEEFLLQTEREVAEQPPPCAQGAPLQKTSGIIIARSLFASIQFPHPGGPGTPAGAEAGVERDGAGLRGRSPRGGGGGGSWAGGPVFGPSGRTPRAPLPGSPRTAQSPPAPQFSVPAPQLWLLEVCAPGRAVPRHPPSPAPSVPVLASPAPQPRAGPLCPASVAALIHPFPGCAALGAPKQGCGPRRAAGAHLGGATPTPAQLLAGPQRPRVPQAARQADCSPPEAEGCAASTRPGKDWSQDWGWAGARQGGTALNALDSPARRCRLLPLLTAGALFSPPTPAAAPGPHRHT